MKQWQNNHYIWNHQRRKKNCNRGTALERSVGKLLVGLKPVFFFACYLTLSSDAAPNYKHMFGPHRGPLSHVWTSQWNIYKRKYWVKGSMAIWSQNTRKPQIGSRWVWPQTIKVRQKSRLLCENGRKKTPKKQTKKKKKKQKKKKQKKTKKKHKK